MITSVMRSALRWLFERSVDLETWAINRKMRQLRGKITPANYKVLYEALSYEGKRLVDEELENAYYKGLHDGKGE